MKQPIPLSAGVAMLYRDVRAVLEQARASAYRAVNFAMVQAYWQVGRLIVEHEQKGKSRAGYGEAVVASLADRLTRELGRGFDERNLWYMRSFYLAFPILNAPRSELPSPTKRAAPGLRARHREGRNGSILAGEPIDTRGSGERWQHWAVARVQSHGWRASRLRPIRPLAACIP